MVGRLNLDHKGKNKLANPYWNGRKIYTRNFDKHNTDVTFLFEIVIPLVVVNCVVVNSLFKVVIALIVVFVVE